MATERTSSQPPEELSLEAVLERRAAGESELTAAQEETEWVCFETGGGAFAVQSLDIEDVVGSVKSYQVPHVPPYVRGVFTRHGSITAILDLSVLRGGPPEEAPRRLLTLRSGEFEAAVPVARIIGVFSVASGQVQKTLDESADYVTGLLDVGGQIFSVIDVDVLLRQTCCRDDKEGAA